MKPNAFRPLVFTGFAVAGLIPVGVLAQEQPQAVITIRADDDLWNVPLTLTTDEITGKQVWIARQFKVGDEATGYLITLDATLNPEPSIAYGLAVVDFGAPSAFSFAFSTLIVPTGSPNVVNASLVGGLTDFTGNDVSITPLLGPDVQIAEVGVPTTNMGVDVGPAFVGTGSGAGALYPYGAFAEGPIPGPGPGPWTTLSLTSAFTLSGGNDIAALTGFGQIVEATVPESGTMIAGGALAVIGLSGFAARRRATR